MIGIGAATSASCACSSRTAGADPKKIIVVDSKGILNRKRDDIKPNYKEKLELAATTNGENREGDTAAALKGQDVLIALSKSGPDVIQKEWVASMADNAIVFVCANPIPEMWPWDAKEAGARIVATGRSDFPNQVNNSVGFPAIFRGTLDVRARTITDEMCIAAAYELARCAEDRGLTEDHLLPTMNEWEVFPREAVAVAKMAMKQVSLALPSLKRNSQHGGREDPQGRNEVGLLMEKGIAFTG